MDPVRRGAVGQSPVFVGQGAVDIHQSHPALLGQLGKQLIEHRYPVVVDAGGLPVGTAAGLLHRGQILQIDYRIGLIGLDLRHKAAEGGEILLGIVIAQLVEPKGYVDLAELGPLLQGLHNGAGLAVHRHHPRLVHPKDPQADVVIKGGALDAAVQPQTLGAGIADEQRVGEIVHLHRRALRHRLGKIQRQGRSGGRDGGRRNRWDGNQGGGRGNGRVGSLRRGPAQHRNGHQNHRHRRRCAHQGQTPPLGGRLVLLYDLLVQGAGQK